MFMFLKRQELPPKAAAGGSTAEVEERRWQQHSYNCWKDHFSRFLCEIPSSECSEGELKRLIGIAALAADEALRLEQERWGRTALKEKYDTVNGQAKGSQ
jgi:hypothetical protein